MRKYGNFSRNIFHTTLLHSTFICISKFTNLYERILKMQALIGLKDCHRPMGISVAFIHQHLKRQRKSMCLLNCALVNDRLHNSETRPRSPFDRSNFVCLSSTLRISGFHNNWMENRCRVVLQLCVKVIGRNACALARLRDLQSRQRWSEGAFEIIFVEISGHELRTVWRRSKLKNKIWHSSH